ncbi:MAG: hypothetical protein WBP64_03145 [Nitrososphaeraceae archaeon]
MVKTGLFEGRLCKYCGLNFDTKLVEILTDVHGTCWQQYRRNNEVYPMPKYAHLLQSKSDKSSWYSHRDRQQLARS